MSEPIQQDQQYVGKSDFGQDLKPSLFTWDVSHVFGQEYVDVFYDASRMLVIQLTLQLLMKATDPEAFPFFTIEFVLMCIYIVLGVLVYWLIFRRVLKYK